jgi:hypothetical protein
MTDSIYLRGGIDVLTEQSALHLPSYNLAHVRTHNDEMLATLLQVFHDKEIIAAFLTALGAQLQELESAYWTILLKMYLDAAEGVNLDVLGRIVGETRVGREDDDYRIAIRARIKMNQCSGTIPQLLEILNILYPRGLFVFEERPPASFRIFLNGLNPTYPIVEYFDRVIRECKAGGVGFGWHHTDNTVGRTFRFSSSDAFEASSTEGFSDDEERDGGYWSDMFTTEEE